MSRVLTEAEAHNEAELQLAKRITKINKQGRLFNMVGGPYDRKYLRLFADRLPARPDGSPGGYEFTGLWFDSSFTDGYYALDPNSDPYMPEKTPSKSRGNLPKMVWVKADTKSAITASGKEVLWQEPTLFAA